MVNQKIIVMTFQWFGIALLPSGHDQMLQTSGRQFDGFGNGGFNSREDKMAPSFYGVEIEQHQHWWC